MGPIKEILAESQFQEELTSSSQTKLVVVDFTASWCGPCQTIAPFYEQLSRKYPNAVFLKVDVDKCQETAVNQRVSVMPTFHFYRNKVKVDSMQGADPQKLEEKIQKYYDDGTAENDVGVAGHVGSSKKSKQTPQKKTVKKPESDTKRESKSSNASKKKMDLGPKSSTWKHEGRHKVLDRTKDWLHQVTSHCGECSNRPLNSDGGEREPGCNTIVKKIFHPHSKEPVDLLEMPASPEISRIQSLAMKKDCSVDLDVQKAKEGTPEDQKRKIEGSPGPVTQKTSDGGSQEAQKLMKGRSVGPQKRKMKGNHPSPQKSGEQEGSSYPQNPNKEKMPPPSK